MNNPVLEVKNLEIRPGGADFALAPLWQKLVMDNRHSGFMQSLEWAAFKAQLGITNKHFGLFKNGELIAGGIFYFVANEAGGSFLVAPHGPVLPWQDEDLARACLRQIIVKCEELAANNDTGLIAMRIEPLLPQPVPDSLLEFGRAPVDLVPNETLCLDLSPSLDDIISAMRPKGRYNIRLSQRKGVQVRLAAAGEIIDGFYPILAQTGRRDHFAVEPLSFFVELASTLVPSGMASLLLAEHDGEVLGGLILITFGGVATYLYGGICNTKRNLMAGYALQWEAIKLAKEAGCIVYDMYGYDRFCSPGNRYGRFSKFKKQFGGEDMRYIGAHDYYFMGQLADTIIRVFKEVEI